MEPYKERMVKEYWELKERTVKLGNMLERWSNGELDFTPTCPMNLLTSQLCAMNLYLNILLRRAKIEGVDLIAHRIEEDKEENK